MLPKNKEHFKKLVPFAQKIILLLKNAGIEPVIHGSFAHFYHTKDKNIAVNDIDLLIPKKKARTLIKLLKKEGIKFKAFPGGYSLIIKKGKLTVETDPFEDTYIDLKKKPFPKNFDKIDFYGIKVKIMRLGILENFYEVALAQSDKTRKKVERRIRSLENFFGRKLSWRKFQTPIKKNK